MAIKTLKPDQINKTGSFNIIYGRPDVGKTWNCVLSLPKPLLFFTGESKGENVGMVKRFGLTDKDIVISPYDEDTTAEDLLESFSDAEFCKPFASIFVDGFSHIMCNKFHGEVTDQAHEARSVKGDVGQESLNE